MIAREKAVTRSEALLMADWLRDEARSEWMRGYRGRSKQFKRAADMIQVAYSRAAIKVRTHDSA